MSGTYRRSFEVDGDVVRAVEVAVIRPGHTALADGGQISQGAIKDLYAFIPVVGDVDVSTAVKSDAPGRTEVIIVGAGLPSGPQIVHHVPGGIDLHDMVSIGIRKPHVP